MNVLYVKLKHFIHVSLVTCQLICNRPICSTAADPKHRNYSEEHPKKVSKCKKCQDKSSFPEVSVKKKTKQVSIGNYFQRRPR